MTTELKQSADQILCLIFIDAFWCLCNPPVSTVEQPKTASAFRVFLVVEIIDVFEVSI